MKIPKLDEYHNEIRTNNGVIMTQAYSVYVGGDEVNDYYLDKDNAEKLASEYINKKYDDVKIIKIK